MEMLKKYFSSILALSIIMTLSLVSPVIAEESNIFSLDEIVVTASRYPQKLEDSIVSVEVIDEEEIAEKSAENVAELLDGLAGLIINDYGGLVGQKSVSIRGTKSRNILILLDGQPLNNPQLGGYDLGQIPVKNIEK